MAVEREVVPNVLLGLHNEVEFENVLENIPEEYESSSTPREIASCNKLVADSILIPGSNLS